MLFILSDGKLYGAEKDTEYGFYLLLEVICQENQAIIQGVIMRPKNRTVGKMMMKICSGKINKDKMRIPKQIGIEFLTTFKSLFILLFIVSLFFWKVYRLI